MTDIKRQLDRVVNNTLQKHIIPVKTSKGILVGSVLIENIGNLKNIWRNGDLLYKDISLNIAAIEIANIMARIRSSGYADKIYKADQEYSRWFSESQFLLKKYYSAKNQKDFDRADVLWAKYCESRDRTQTLKNTVMSLTTY